MPPKSDIDYITEFLNDHDASGYAKTVRELAEENEGLHAELAEARQLNDELSAIVAKA